jgi:hypothetical protein
LESCLLRYVIQRPESITLLMLYVYSSLSRTRSIDEDAIELGTCRLEIVASISLLTSDDRRSLELTVVHETIIADLVLFDRGDEACILHEHRELSRLGSWGRTDVEYDLTWLWIECENREHRCDRLEIYLPIIERASSLDCIFMGTIERIDSVESCKGNYYDFFFTEFCEYSSLISSQSIDPQ